MGCGSVTDVVEFRPRQPAPPPPPPPDGPAEVRLLWGVVLLNRRGPDWIGTEMDLSLEPVRVGHTERYAPQFIVARRTRADFTVAFRLPARSEYLASAANDRGD